LADRFGVGDSVSFVITGAGITASSFDVLSTPAGGHGPFKTAAHAQGIDPNASQSGWIAPDGGGGPVIPLPASAWMGLALLGGMGVTRLIRARARARK